ncbi:hypothetical protein CEXT_497291 [Caerostris extrusa]|uniref:Uncharacterized protein n=1 Tax=Caerostris extrusa TaxID=172846 RepID=A0AAV4NA03_CAEEX|nr:hypothetical protein CEXT_497291 [Caerostris extrusa]
MQPHKKGREGQHVSSPLPQRPCGRESSAAFSFQVSCRPVASTPGDPNTSHDASLRKRGGAAEGGIHTEKADDSSWSSAPAV